MRRRGSPILPEVFLTPARKISGTVPRASQHCLIPNPFIFFIRQYSYHLTLHSLQQLTAQRKHLGIWAFSKRTKSRFIYALCTELAQHIIQRRDFVMMIMNIRMVQHDQLNNSLGLEAVTPVVTKCWGTAPCSPLKFNRCSRGTCLLHLHGRIIGQARNQHESGSKENKMEATCFSETSVDFQRTTRNCVSGETTPQLNNS
jgi:hypothetical protein